MTYGYRLYIYKADRRCKAGERLHGTYEYANYSGNAMMDEMKDLRQRLYPAKDGWRMDFEPLTTVVKNLMTGKDVEIDYRNRGGCCDPSTERYWTM